MTDSSESYLESARHLCDTLERIGDGLVTLDTPTRIETADTLNRLLTALRSTESTGDRREIEAMVRRGREALGRCRTPGATFDSDAKVHLQLCSGVDPVLPDDASTGDDSIPTPTATA